MTAYSRWMDAATGEAAGLQGGCSACLLPRCCCCWAAVGLPLGGCCWVSHAGAVLV